MPPLSDFAFSPSEALEQIEDLSRLLDTDEDLGERSELLPFFQNNQQVAAALGRLFGRISVPNRLALEYRIQGRFVADIVVGDSDTSAFAFIELEDAGANSIFETRTREVSHWSRRFTDGFYQLVDWSYAINVDQSPQYRRTEFGDEQPDYRHILVIGRQPMLSAKEERRLKWHQQSIAIQGAEVFTLTFDEVVGRLRRMLSLEVMR